MDEHVGPHSEPGVCPEDAEGEHLEHVYPTGRGQTHELSNDCPCDPWFLLDEFGWYWLHRAKPE